MSRPVFIREPPNLTENGDPVHIFMREWGPRVSGHSHMTAVLNFKLANLQSIAKLLLPPPSPDKLAELLIEYSPPPPPPRQVSRFSKSELLIELQEAGSYCKRSMSLCGHAHTPHMYTTSTYPPNSCPSANRRGPVRTSSRTRF